MSTAANNNHSTLNTTAKFIMMLGQQLIVTVLCLGAVFAAPNPKEDSLNNYIDMVMENLQILIVENGYDPAPLPNATTGFSDTVLGVTWHGEATAYDGWLRGLASVYRSENAEFVRDDDGIVIGLSTGMGLSAMQGHYKLLAKFMDLGPVADVVMDINGASIFFAAALDRTSCRFHVSTMDVTNIGHISVDIHGLGPLNWIFEIVVDMVVNVVRLFIKNTVESIIQGFTNDVLDQLDLGPLGPIIGCDNPRLVLHRQPRSFIPRA
ncbi:uncharacterized protein [Penaeus vannamei]|uniref:uncharacterized protein isoform X2 n=1 Tax=Penaeus vannamei TaxID=6689 RepID=UPI00387F5D08